MQWVFYAITVIALWAYIYTVLIDRLYETGGPGESSFMCTLFAVMSLLPVLNFTILLGCVVYECINRIIKRRYE